MSCSVGVLGVTLPDSACCAGNQNGLAFERERHGRNVRSIALRRERGQDVKKLIVAKRGVRMAEETVGWDCLHDVSLSKAYPKISYSSMLVSSKMGGHQLHRPSLITTALVLQCITAVWKFESGDHYTQCCPRHAFRAPVALSGVPIVAGTRDIPNRTFSIMSIRVRRKRIRAGR